MAIQGKKINELTQLNTVTDETVLPVVYVDGQTTAETAQKITVSQVSSKVQSDLSSTLATKQDVLTAGNGIDISNNSTISAQQAIEALVASSGTIALDTNKVYKISLDGNTTFSLPVTVDNTVFNQILLQLQITGTITIDWGTTHYFIDALELEAGVYDIVYEYNSLENVWYVGRLGGASGSSYILPIAGSNVLGGVKVGSGLSIAQDGTLSVSGGLDNPTGAYFELTKSVSQGKTQLATAISNKGTASTTEDSLMQMATKINNLDVVGEKDYIIATPVTATSSSSSGFYYYAQIPGTNYGIGCPSNLSTVSIVDAANNLLEIGSCSTGLSEGPSGSSIVFTFSRTGQYVLVKGSTKAVCIKISAQGEPTVQGVVITLANNQNSPVIINDDGTKLFTVNYTSSSATNSCSIYNLSDGTSVSCTNVNNYYFSNVSKYMHILDTDNKIYTIHYVSSGSSINTTVYVTTSSIDWENNSVSWNESESNVVFDGYSPMFNNDPGSGFSIYFDSKNFLMYFGYNYYDTFIADSKYKQGASTAGMAKSSLYIIDIKTLTYKNIDLAKILYINSGYSLDTSSPSGFPTFVEFNSTGSTIYTPYGVLEYINSSSQLNLISQNIEVNNTKVCSFVNTKYTSSKNDNSNIVYKNGNSIILRAAAGLSGTTGTFGWFDYQICYLGATSIYLHVFDLSNLLNQNPPKYVVGFNYQRNNGSKLMFLPDNTLTQAMLESGELDVENTGD